MTLFRLRRWGSADWLTLSLDSDDGELEEQVEVAICTLFAAGEDQLHVQQFVEGNWEDME